MRLVIILFSFLISINTFAQKVTVESLREMQFIGNVAISPGDDYLIYSLARSDVENNSFNSTVQIMDLSTMQSNELISGVSDVKWSPDGKKISYRKSEDGMSGIYVASFTKGKRLAGRKIADVHSSNHFLGHPTKKNYAWSPDSKWIAYTSADPETGFVRTDPNEPLVVERTMYKSRTSFSDLKITRVYLASSDGKTQKMLTKDDYDSHSVSWDNDSQNVIFLSNKSTNPDHNYNNDIYTVDINSLQQEQLTVTVGTEHDPNVSPTGRWIAYPGTVRPVNTKDSPPENTDIYLLSIDTKEEKNLTASLDRRASGPMWHSSGEYVYFRTRDEGKGCLYRSSMDGKTSPVICGMGSVGGISVGKNKIVYTWSGPGQPAELYICDINGGNQKKISSIHETWAQKHELAEVEDFWFSSFDGTRVQGFIAYPKNLSTGTELPVVHRIHGGPHGMYGYSFSDFNELLVSAGYVVIFINPRGSTGYGQKFADGTYQAWGGGDYKDLMAGMDAAIEKYDFLDEDNMMVTGGSYGGFMTNWVVTQTDRYKAAVTVASVSNLISFYGTSLYQLLIETEFNGMPWDNYSLLWHFSPMAHIKNVTTPTLLLHGENDIDVPITQAEEFFIGLKKLGVDTRFVRYPNEGHGLRQPIHREHYMNEVLSWFNQYSKQKGS